MKEILLAALGQYWPQIVELGLAGVMLLWGDQLGSGAVNLFHTLLSKWKGVATVEPDPMLAAVEGMFTVLRAEAKTQPRVVLDAIYEALEKVRPSALPVKTEPTA